MALLSLPFLFELQQKTNQRLTSMIWSAYCDVSMPPEGLREFLPRLIQTLVSNMVYTDDHESLVDAEV